MKCLTILLLLPVFLNAQPFDNWLTPFATVEFEDEQIVFRVPMMDVSCGFEPIFLLNDDFLVQYEPMHHISCADIQEGFSTLGSYLENPLYPDGSNSDRIRYIKAFALQTFLALRGDGLPSAPVYDKVRQMADGPNRKIVQMANMATRLYRGIETSLIEQSGLVNYLSFTGLSGQDFELFSAERLMQTNNSKLNIPEGDSIVWPKLYSQANLDTYAEVIIESYDLGYLVCGNFNTYNGNSFKQWSWLIKTDINGNVLWDKIIEGGDEFIRTIAITQTSDGSLLTCGLIWSSLGKYEPYIMKLNSCGEKEWCKIFSGSVKDNPWAHDIIEISTGELFVLVNNWGTYGVEDMYIFKLDSEGNALWKKPICTGYNHPESAKALGFALLETSTHNLLVSGRAYWAHPWEPGGTKWIRPVYVLIDSAGNEEWVLPIGLQDTLYGSAEKAIQIDENTFIGVGAQWPNAAARNMWIMEFDGSGNVVNSKILDATSLDSSFVKGFLADFQKIGDTMYFGGFSGTLMVGFIPAVEFSSDLNIFTDDFAIFNKVIHDNTRDPYSLCRTYDNKLLSNPTFNGIDNIEIMLSKLNLNLEYDTAYPGVYTYDSLCTTPGLPQSGFIFLDDCDIITGIEIPSPEEYYASVQTIVVTAYPNPAETEITLAFQNTEHHNNMLLECYNLFGQRVHSEKVYKGQQKTKLSIEQWQSGLYIAVIKSDERVAGNVRFVRR
jgi:hypothetical protein